MYRGVRLSDPIIPVLIRVLDVIVILATGYSSLYARRFMYPPPQLPDSLTGYYSLIAAAGLLFLILSRDVYRSWRGSAIPVMLIKVAGTWLLVMALLLLWLFVNKVSEDYSRLWFLLWTFAGLSLLWIIRVGAYYILRILRRKGLNLKHVALVGEGPPAENLLRRLRQAGWTGYNITEHLTQPSHAKLEELASRTLDEIWLAIPLSSEQVIRETLHGLRHTSANLRFAPDWFTLRLIHHGISEVAGVPMLDLSTSPMTGFNRVLKYLEDKILSSLILIIASPVMILLAVGVKLSSPGPVFYRQERVGLNNRPFVMLKFRSMPVDIEENEIKWGDAKSKVTGRFGKFIRQTSLDELPQFINVLKGDMSIVGPRPERPFFVNQFKEEIPDYMRKHLVKAGITGWAQVNGWRGDTDLEARIEHDLYYIENWSLQFDIKIILMTILKGFVNNHAY